MGRGVKIAGAVVLMAAVIVGVGEGLRRGGAEHRAPVHDGGVLAVVRAASSPLRADPRDASLAPQMAPAPGVNRRSLAVYYERRAYPGAPPAVPHAVDPTFDRTQACNVCHEKGGFTPKFNAYVPVTPHPEYGNCLQCHAKGAARPTPFVENRWLSVQRPALHRPALPGNPPPIPHALQLRASCLSCHAGPAAVPEVRTSHPERVNCQQCHVPRTTQTVYQRDRRDDRGGAGE